MAPYFREDARSIAVAATKRGSEFDCSLCEVDEFANRLVAEVTVASGDAEGDGLSGHSDEQVYDYTPDQRRIFSLSTAEKKSILTPEILSRRFHIGLPSAKWTLRCTTQSGIRNVLVPAERRMRQSDEYATSITIFNSQL
jgi:hypothetical protein